MTKHIANFSPAEYFGCDGATPDSGPWQSWITGDDDLLGPDFAQFIWWHLCDLMLLFRDLDASARDTGQHTAVSFEASINQCLDSVELDMGIPLEVMNPFEFDSAVLDAFERQDRKRVIYVLAFGIWCIDRLIDALRHRDAQASAFSSAAALRTLELVHEYRNTFPEVMARVESKRQSERAKRRHENSAKHQEVLFVHECWMRWQQSPNDYEGKEAFARAMLDKCEHLVSSKHITTLCRNWERKSRQPIASRRIESDR